MYQFSGKIKIVAIAFIILGLLGIAYGFISSSGKNLDDAKKIIEHREAKAKAAQEKEATKVKYHTLTSSEKQNTTAAHDEAVGEDQDEAHADEHHAEHVLHQLQNRPWAALFVGMFFLFVITLGIFVFYAMQIGASAGWSVVLFRVMEAFSANIVPIGILMFLFLLASAFDLNHLYVWMHAENDPAIESKRFWLNIPAWLIRSAIYIGGYILLRYIIRKKSLKQDEAKDYSAHKKGFTYTIIFIAFFMLTESGLAWDWVMSLDPHWFSSLFGWYIFASMMVSAITVLALLTMYLKKKGYLEFVNSSHLHDLGKYMFGFSIFWAYLWFAQYMLIWYANMPEETVYFGQRYEQYNYLFFGMVALNLLFPLIILMDIDAKKNYWIMTIIGVILLIGHYVDFFVMIMPATVGESWSFGIPEIGALLFFIGLFLFVGFRALSRQPLLAKGNPYVKESLDYHYYNLEN